MEYLRQNGLEIKLLPNLKLRLLPAEAVTAEIRQYAIDHREELLKALQDACGAQNKPTNVCECESAPPAVNKASVVPDDPRYKLDLVACGAYLHKEFNRTRRALERDIENSALARQFSALCDHIDEHWRESKFKHGWFYG